MRFTIPNLLTLFRIALIPVFVAVFYSPFEWKYVVTAAIFSIAGITDWFDGYLARRLNQMTSFGAFLDPVADKLIVAIALALLIDRYSEAWFTIPAIVIIGREILISALREWMAEIGERANVAVSNLGKWKTTFQIISIIVLLADVPGIGQPWFWIGIVCLYLAALLTLWSMVSYLKAAWRYMS